VVHHCTVSAIRYAAVVAAWLIVYVCVPLLPTRLRPLRYRRPFTEEAIHLVVYVSLDTRLCSPWIRGRIALRQVDASGLQARQ